MNTIACEKRGEIWSDLLVCGDWLTAMIKARLPILLYSTDFHVVLISHNVSAKNKSHMCLSIAFFLVDSKCSYSGICVQRLFSHGCNLSCASNCQGS